MNEIFTLESFWLRLDGPSVIAMRQTCTLGEKMSIQYRAIDVLIYCAGRKIARYLNYYSYFSARHTCRLWSQALPAKGLDDRIDQTHEQGHHAIVQALDDSLCWTTRHRFQIHHNEGIIRVNPYDISKPLIPAGLLAFESLTFHVPAGQEFIAELLIGGIYICEYCQEAQSNDYTLIDKVFTMPLIIDVDWASSASMKWHDIEIRSNCPITVGFCIQEQIHPQMQLFMPPQIYNQTSPEVIHYLSQSPYRFNRDYPALYYVRWNCMNFPFTR